MSGNQNNRLQILHCADEGRDQTLEHWLKEAGTHTVKN